MVTVVPPAGGQVIVMLPWCASTNRFAIGSPNPVPRALVVKNGMKILSRTSTGIPGPLSLIAIVRCAPAAAIST